MRKVFAAICLLLSVCLLTVQTAQAANPSAAGIFNSIGGTTTIDRGGAIHSQARSIYSLGGGMTSFEGKRVSLLAADPPSFSAGCNGISWHFGGFAFISLDEIRQLVEAVAQASLGIAVDLAMQTLCPQCYAVMAKLREIANAMRNAAADACRIAQNFGALLKDSGIIPSTNRASDCSKSSAESGQTSSFLDSWAGSACRLLSDAETKLGEVADATMDFLRFGNTDGKSPSREMLDTTGNVTFKALSALGYPNGFIKDIMLSLLGMTIVYPKPDQDCRAAFRNLYGSAEDNLKSSSTSAEEQAALKKLLGETPEQGVKSSSSASAPSVNDIKTNGAKNTAGGSQKGPTFCNAPPLMTGLEAVGISLMCGFNLDAEMADFAGKYFGGDVESLKKSSLGAMCSKQKNADAKNPLVYSCSSSSDTADCLEPKMTRLQNLLDTEQIKGYTGLAWMIGDALYGGALQVKANKPLDTNTVRILNGSGWPLYRLINMAAVYPAMAGELLNAYSAAIAAQYAMDTLDKVAAIGAQPAINMRSQGGIRPESISVLRENIMTLVRNGNESKNQVLARLAEKRQMVEVIMQVNKTLQAEVIGQGLGGNTDLAVNIKRWQTPPKND